MFYIIVFKVIHLFTQFNKSNWTETKGNYTFQISFFNHKNVKLNYIKLPFVIKNKQKNGGILVILYGPTSNFKN